MKKCPFCGESKHLEWHGLLGDEGIIGYVILCLECGAKGPPADSRVEAQEEWNNR